MYFSNLLLVPFGIGLGIVAYAVAVAFYTLLAVWRLRRHAAREAKALREIERLRTAQPMGADLVLPQPMD
jgi:Flp pilus assembly protein TadB